MVDILGQIKAGYSMGEDIARRPQRNALADLALQAQRQSLTAQQAQMQQAEATAGRQATQFDQGQAIQRAKFLNQSAKAFKMLDQADRSSAFERLAPQLEQFGIDPAQFANSAFTDQDLDQVIASTEGFIKDPSTMTAAMREREADLKAIAPFVKNGKFDKENATPAALAAAMNLGIEAKKGTQTKEERTALDPDLAEKIASSQSMIESRIKEAETIAKSRGESITSLVQAKGARQGIQDVAEKLMALSDKATFTLTGKARDAILKEFGFSTEGGTARSAMIATINNQVLPLLKPIFGSAFTENEGNKLTQALADPDGTPDSRKVAIQSFVEQFDRNIQTLESESQQFGEIIKSPVSGNEQKPKRIRFDAQGNIIND